MDDYTAALQDAAQRLAAVLIQPKEGETIKLVSGVVESVNDIDGSAMVKIGDSKIKALNKSKDRLSAGQSVWLGYIKSLADAIILFRTGSSFPGVGEDMGSHNERFNDYVGNSAPTPPTAGCTYNTLKGEGNAVLEGASKNLLCGSGNTARGGASKNLMCGTGNTTRDGAINNFVGGNGNTAGGLTAASIMYGSGNSSSGTQSNSVITGNGNTLSGQFESNAITGQNGTYGGTASGNVYAGEDNSLTAAYIRNNLVAGYGNYTVSGATVELSNNIIGGVANRFQQDARNNIVGGESNNIATSNNIIVGIDNQAFGVSGSGKNIMAGSENQTGGKDSAVFGAGCKTIDTSLALGRSSVAHYDSEAAGFRCWAKNSSIAVGEGCIAGIDAGYMEQYNWNYSYLTRIESSSGYACATFGYGLINNSNFGTAIGKFNDLNIDVALQIGGGTNESSRENVFEVDWDGSVTANGPYGTSGADYAEYEEWADGNPENEDRVGHFVTYTGNKIRYANASDDYILGVVSATPSVIGNNDIHFWRGKYTTDIYGRVKYHDIEVVKTQRDENGENIEVRKTISAPIISKNFDPEQTYIPRAERPEWSPVGTHGKLIVIDDGTCEVDGYCKPADGGIGTKGATQNGAYRVIERLDKTHIRIVIK